MYPQVTWPAYFVEFVRTMEDQRRRDEAKAAAELVEAEGESDGIMSDDDSSSSSVAGEGGDKGDGRRRRRGSSSKGDGEAKGEDYGDDGDGADSEEEEEEEDERDPLDTLCSAFQAGEHHLLPLEMKVQALEYLVERAIEVREKGSLCEGGGEARFALLYRYLS